MVAQANRPCRAGPGRAGPGLAGPGRAWPGRAGLGPVTKSSGPYLLREEIPPRYTSQKYIMLTTFATSHFPCARVQCHEIHKHYKDYVVEEDVLVGYVVINDVKGCKGLSTPL